MVKEAETPKQVSRRDFIKVTAMGTAVLASGGVIAGCKAAPAKVGVPEKWDKEADVVIVGAGGGGLFAAITAHDAGADVIVLEKAPTLYSSSTAICGGTISGAGTKLQTQEGVTDSVDVFYDDLLKNGKYGNITELTRLFADNSGETIDFLIDWGAPFNLGPGSPDHSNRRNHILYPSSQYIDVLNEQIENRNISVLMETNVTNLFIDPSTNRVIGVEAEGAGAGTYKAKKAVILATGGFGGSAPEIDRYCPDMKDMVLSGSSPQSTGDGLRMCKKLGADTTHTQFTGTYPCGLELDPTGKPRVGTMFSSRNYWYCVLVNKNGKRFVNEYVSATKMTRYLIDQPGGIGLPVADKNVWEQMLSLPYIVVGWSQDRIEEEVEKEVLFKKADTIRELAEWLGVDPTNLEETIANYNSYVEKGEDLEFGRNPEWMFKIEEPPFYACSGVRPITMLVVGGVRINPQLQVVDPYDNPIPGLYAVGEVTGGTMGTTYLAGCNLGIACTFGRLAAQNAVKEEAWG